MAESLVSYDRALPEIAGRRAWEKPHSYLVKDDSAESGYREDKSGRRPSDLLLVPKLRRAVDTWREAGYPGASGVTRRLFEYWFEEDHEVSGFDAPFRYYFCQREAVETLAWLVEISGQRDTQALIRACATVPGRDLFSDGIAFETTMDGRRRLRRWFPKLEREDVQDLPPQDLRRYALKMATGSGKTWVMAMVIAWCRLHKLLVAGSDLATNFLVVAPNVIVYQRLEKDFANNRVFNELPLIPPEWRHGFGPKVILRGETAEPDASGNLFLTNVQQLYESRDDEWTPANAVEALLGRQPAKDLGASGRRSMLERLKSLPDLVVLNDEAHHVHSEELEWSQSLLAVHEALPGGLTAWLDFTATPRDQNGRSFPWTVVDYPLAQAVEDRIVKAPLIVTQEAGQGAPIEDPDRVVKADAVEKYGYWLRAAVERWKEHCEVYGELKIAPVLFIVAENNAQADALGEHLSAAPEFDLDADEVLVIHTVKGGDVRKGDLEKARQAARDIDGRENRIKVIVSVMMLREGWDVKSVTVVLGLRPFTARAEILPEQVIGRGLRLMAGVGPDSTQTLEVLGTPKLLGVLRDELEREGVGVVTTKTKPPLPIVIEPVRERLQYDIGIPLTKPSLSHDQRKLADLDVQALRPIFDQEELAEPFRITLRMEFATTETEVSQVDMAGAERPLQELLAETTNRVIREAGLTNRFAELYPSVRDYIRHRCFGKSIELDDKAVRSHLARPEIKEAIAKYLARRIGQLTIERREIAFQNSAFRLSGTKPFHWRRNLEPEPVREEKTVFNFVATYNNFEREFARFLGRAGDVLRFAALGTTEQGGSGSSFRVDYLKPGGAIGFYYPDWVVVQRSEEGELNWIVETKGRVWEGTSEKDAAMREWCRRVSAATGDTWRYVRVNQREFRPDFATFRKLVVTVVGGAMFSERDQRGTTMSREEVRQARDEGRG